MIKKTLFIIVFFIILEETRGQQSFVVSGGDTSVTANGSFSYSIGQISHLEFSGNNYIINNGVQHAYEIQNIDVKDPIILRFKILLYPNPTESDLYLKIDDYLSAKFSYQVYDIQGKFLLQNQISELETLVPLGHFSSGTYVIKIDINGTISKHFNIIKK